MKVSYFDDTDTLLDYFNDKKIVETKELNESTLVELDKNEDIVSMNIECVKHQTKFSSFSFLNVPKIAEQ